MQPQLCSRCKKNVAVVFITRMENGKNINEGLCLKCAKNLGLPQVNEMMQRMGITDEDLDNISNEMMSAFGGAENLEGIDAPDGDDEEDGKTATFPFLGRLFGGQNGDAPAPADGKLWSAICAAVMDKMPFDVRGYLGDESKVCAAVEGDVLRVEVVPGFVYGRVNKPDIIQRFSDAARSISGREMRVLLTELKPKPRQQRSLEELKQFEEVKFI